MWFKLLLIGVSVFASLESFALVSRGIELSPTQAQIEQVLRQGIKVAKDRVPPNLLYNWFGSDKELEPKGFLMTKMNSLRVLSSHFALRGEKPNDQDLQNILAEETMLVSIILFGHTPSFAKNSYIVLKQGEKLVKPIKIRFDGIAHRTHAWPDHPRYKAKVIGSFRYDSFNPTIKTKIIIFKNEGREVSFDIDFANIP